MPQLYKLLHIPSGTYCISDKNHKKVYSITEIKKTFFIDPLDWDLSGALFFSEKAFRNFNGEPSFFTETTFLLFNEQQRTILLHYLFKSKTIALWMFEDLGYTPHISEFTLVKK